MKRKLLLLLLALTTVLCVTFGISACDTTQDGGTENGTTGGNENNDTNEAEIGQAQYTEGLSYTLSEDQSFYYVSGIGTATATNIVIANQIESIPVTFIDNGAFSGCISLTSVTIPDSVISIGKYAFEYCISLTSVIIPDSVTSIGYDTFYNCSSLTSVDIGNGVTSISNYTFRNCISLSSVSIGNGVESIGNYAFEGCSKLTSIEVDKNNQNYTSIDGNLYSKDKTILIKYAIGKTDKEFSIPDSATSIAEYAFYDCRSLTSVNIENGQLNKNKSAAEYNVI